MAYRVELSEPLDDSLRRLARERIEKAVEQLDEHLAADPQTAIHEARKDVKKARALLRLFRRPLVGSAYRRENRALRNAGRELSVLRDAHVLRHTIDAVAERFAGRLPAGAFDALRARLGAGEIPAEEVAQAVDAARGRLARSLVRVDRWDAHGADPVALRKALGRTYARGARAMARAARERSDEALHEWRKRVKDLRYQQQLIRPAWPDLLAAQAGAAKQLGELLGDDHDLAVLEQRSRAAAGDIAQLDDVLELVAHRRRELQEEAFRLGRRVYAEAPKRFAARIGRYLRSGMRDSHAELAA
jgi:CHAD domain-containing protein